MDKLRLADKLENSTLTPSRYYAGCAELDAEIEQAILGDFLSKCEVKNGRYHHPEFGLIARPQEYTGSIEAALSVIPKGVEFEITNIHGVARATVGLNAENPTHAHHEGGSLPTAICAAALRLLSQPTTEPSITTSPRIDRA